MIDLMQFPDISAATPEGQVQQMKDYLFNFVQKYNLMAQEVNREISELKEKVDHGNL